MISLGETIVTLAEAAALLPRRRAGKKVHTSCVYRWTTSGCRGVILESLQVGNTRCTSREALERFFAALAVPRIAVPQQPPEGANSRLDRIAAAEAELRRPSR
ncbi:hypothetical protein ETAA8_35580 [Anatilimnocola aggregata]|uniref:DUF1580 domain-containing protein n=1 Tax=Anatilimnocola aggregata TaxID=2528021 RepID=A0A517YDZ2_9BACT|nr:DUF1580 domain-containing protein [Anatilimnocola aggregata]QDU28458.1 hypothetical protein ETAA8_35580 [Anatilimnocola aggregata]